RSAGVLPRVHDQHAGRGAQPGRRQQRHEDDCDYRQGVVAPEKAALHELSIQGGREDCYALCPSFAYGGGGICGEEDGQAPLRFLFSLYALIWLFCYRISGCVPLCSAFLMAGGSVPIMPKTMPSPPRLRPIIRGCSRNARTPCCKPPATLWACPKARW